MASLIVIDADSGPLGSERSLRFNALAKNLHLAPTACGCGRRIGQRSRAKGKKKNRTFKFSQFLFSYKGWSIRNIRKLAPYENFPLYGKSHEICKVSIYALYKLYIYCIVI